jgi:hypothetical protein
MAKKAFKGVLQIFHELLTNVQLEKRQREEDIMEMEYGRL